MKRFVLLAFVPLVLFALEPVNLIKDAGFEKNSDVWVMKSVAVGEYDSTIIKRHDPDSACIGEYCGSVDTRKQPALSIPAGYYEWGALQQIFNPPKKLGDLDSLILSHSAIFRIEGNKNSAESYGIWFRGIRPADHALIDVLYHIRAPDIIPAGDTPTKKAFNDTIKTEGIWDTMWRDLKQDLIDDKGLTAEIEIDTILLFGNGFNDAPWRGQKVFFDAVRLTGYADYDVGVKEILSGDSLWAGVDYTPVARIKNFGREAADDFLVIAEIKQAETLVWADTVPYTLPADTEDTLEFGSFPVPDAASYTLTVRTEMVTPGAIDESDEDDVLSKPLYGTAIAENPQPQTISLEVESFTANPRISYSLPDGQSGVLRVYDASGRKVESRTVQGSGVLEFPSLASLASGVYFVKLETNRTSLNRKLVFLH